MKRVVYAEPYGFLEWHSRAPIVGLAICCGQSPMMGHRYHGKSFAGRGCWCDACNKEQLVCTSQDITLFAMEHWNRHFDKDALLDAPKGFKWASLRHYGTFMGGTIESGLDAILFKCDDFTIPPHGGAELKEVTLAHPITKRQAIIRTGNAVGIWIDTASCADGSKWYQLGITSSGTKINEQVEKVLTWLASSVSDEEKKPLTTSEFTI